MSIKKEKKTVIEKTRPKNTENSASVSKKSFWSRVYGFFIRYRKTSQKSDKNQVILLKKPSYYEKEIYSYDEYLDNRHKYKKLISQYSKLISQKKAKVSVADLVPNPTKYAVELNHASKYYLTERKVNKVFHNVSLKIKQNDFVCVLGPSGSGKTTLLNIIAGLDAADNGDVFVNGQNLALLNSTDLTLFRRENIGLIFQQYNLLENITVKENIELGANLLPKNREAISLGKLMDMLEISDLADSFPHQLSGGQQQRFALARALAKNPRILFCDEPTGALDSAMSNKVISTLQMINKKYKTTIVMVTHEESFVKYASTVIQLRDGVISNIRQKANLTNSSNKS